MEGVMIKSPKKLSLAVRLQDGKIKTKVDKHITKTKGIYGMPFVRGIIQLVDMLIIGTKALQWSAEQQGEEEIGKKEWAIVFIFAMAMTIGLFILAPYYLSKIFFETKSLYFGLTDGIIRLVIFLGYLFIIGLMPDIKRMFEYHGAEHMTVHCHESGQELIVKNVQKFAKEHARCGTSLLVFVIGLTIIAFSLIRSQHWYYNIPLRIVFIPVIAGISYEFLKIGDKIKWLSYPGIWVQKLTTRKPDAKQIEVAIKAVENAK